MYRLCTICNFYVHFQLLNWLIDYNKMISPSWHEVSVASSMNLTVYTSPISLSLRSTSRSAMIRSEIVLNFFFWYHEEISLACSHRSRYCTRKRDAELDTFKTIGEIHGDVKILLVDWFFCERFLGSPILILNKFSRIFIEIYDF